jgi:hypothetical protein
LKTGYIVGATPWRQQVGLVIGVLASTFAIGITLFVMHQSGWGPIGSDRLPAPQGTLMATLIKGILGGNLQWTFVFVGAAMAVRSGRQGVGALRAVGAYLRLSAMPIPSADCAFHRQRLSGEEKERVRIFRCSPPDRGRRRSAVS